MQPQTFYVSIRTKKYPLVITPTGKTDPEDGAIIHISCPIINVDQDYLLSDLSALLMDLPSMIEEELDQKADSNLHIRLKNSEKKMIEKKAQQQWYRSLSEFVKDKCLAS